MRSAGVTGLSGEANRRLAIFADLLVHWQKTINLVAPSTLPDLWTRHIADSMQVVAAAPEALRWVDLGSGGGFPGLVTAILLADVPGADVHLVESDKRKAAFLRTVARETDAPAIVRAERIETFVPAYNERVDAVSARALAPLPRLVAYAEKFLNAGAIGVFHKGQNAESELTGFDGANRFEIQSVQSRTDRSSSLIIVRAGQRMTV
jgi:16S rRNA (guanine527-N7)-methyltransferase